MDYVSFDSGSKKIKGIDKDITGDVRYEDFRMWHLTAWMWSIMRQIKTIIYRCRTSIFIGLLIFALGIVGCGNRPDSSRPARLSSNTTKRFYEEIIEVAPPEAIQTLHQEMDGYQPQVKILSPQPGDVIEDTAITVQLSVSDLPLFKEKDMELGPHVEIILDDNIEQEFYGASEPIIFDHLTPGSHTLRAVASHPWHESFKNAGAYDQVTFNIFTNTASNAPVPDHPLLTYNQPRGTYGAQPILLDFYLTDAPLHMLAREFEDDDITDWKIRGTVNGQSFTFDTWEPIYLQGFVPGLNWVKLELVDESDDVIDGPFNSTAQLIHYEPNGQDTLSQMIRGELDSNTIFKIIDPNYEPESGFEVNEPDSIESDGSELNHSESEESNSEESNSEEFEEQAPTIDTPSSMGKEPHVNEANLSDEAESIEVMPALTEMNESTAESPPELNAENLNPQEEAEELDAASDPEEAVNESLPYNQFDNSENLIDDSYMGDDSLDVEPSPAIAPHSETLEIEGLGS